MLFRASLDAVGAVALALTATSITALADDSSPLPATAPRMAESTPAASVAHVLIGDYISSGATPGLSLTTGYHNLDNPTTIKCSNTSGCTISVGSTVQVAPPAGSNWAICAVIDGVYMTPACPYMGVLPGAGSYVAGSERFQVAVTQGTHTVQSQVYVGANSLLGNWQVDYMLYKP